MWDLGSPTRDWTCVSCIRRQILNHWTTREFLPLTNFKLCVCVCVCVCVHACIYTHTLTWTLCDPMDCSPPGSSVHGILQQECSSGLPHPPPGDLPDPGIELASFMSPALTGGFFTTSHLGSPDFKVKVRVSQSCQTLCDPLNYTVHGILQAGILEWVAFPSSRGSSQPRDQTQVSHITGGFFTCWAKEKPPDFKLYLTKSQNSQNCFP